MVMMVMIMVMMVMTTNDIASSKYRRAQLQSQVFDDAQQPADKCMMTSIE